MGELPDGAVTFLFSDIVGSTARWEEHGPAMRDALRRHDELLTAAVERRHGHLVKHTGDGALAVFTSPAGAVTAAVDIQRALTDEDWGEVGGVTARVAVHTGEAERRDGDYFGPAVNRAHRLMDAGHGGQILVSHVTAELARDQLPEGARLVDLGEHRLPDVPRPERILQVVAPGLAERYPPLRTLEAVPTNLPQPRTSFVGRQRALALLTDLVGEQRLVTLTGTGGAGKTRLAIEVGRVGLDTFPDGVRFADLAPLTDEVLVAKTVADAVGLPVPTGFGTATARPVVDDLSDFLAAARLLLVVDNCEHLLDGCAELVDLLLERCPDLHVLATSREPLRVEGEHVWPVASLSLPAEDEDAVGAEDAEAMRLLLDRARAVRPDLELTAETRAAMARICRALDGIPLTLELAAARMAHLSPGEVADRLADRFSLLRGGPRRSRRQRTLEAAVDWSYDLLNEDERVLLRRLSVFSGGATLSAIEDICASGLGGRPVVDVLASLVDRSLVVVEQDRYRLLETIRLYAAEKLAASGGGDGIRTRHRDWYLALAEGFPWDQAVLSPVAGAALGPEHDNLRQTLEWSRRQGRGDLVARLAVACTAMLNVHAHFDEAERWHAAAQAADLPTELAAQLSVCGAFIEMSRRVREPAWWLDEGAPRMRGALDALPDDHPASAAAWFVLAGAHATATLDADAIERAAEQARAHAHRAGFPLLESYALWMKAFARLYAGDHAASVRVLERAIRVPGFGPEHGTWNIFVDLALALHLAGEHDRALEEVAHIEPRSGAWDFMGPVIAAVVAAGAGDRRGAANALAEAARTVTTSRWHPPFAVNDCLVACAALFTAVHDHERASRCLAVTQALVSTPSLFALYLHHRDQVRAALDRETRRRLVEEARGLDPEEVLSEAVAAAVRVAS